MKNSRGQGPERNSKIFKKLEVWQKPYDLCSRVYRIKARFPKEERHGLTSQIRRSAVLVPSEIAEGFGGRTIADKNIRYQTLGSLTA